MSRKYVTREELNDVVEALWSELDYQNKLDRRAEDEGTNIPGFLTLADVYLRKTADAWAKSPAVEQPDGSFQVSEAQDGIRKVAAIMIRAMVYNGAKMRT